MRKCAIKNLNPGDRFIYGMKSAIVLDKMDDGILCMVVDEDYQSEFDRNNNNFAVSTLREELNSLYLERWIEDGANLSDFVEMEVDLTADDGLDDYGTCNCYLAPRTCDQHRKYRKLIPNYERREWMVTPWSTESNGNSFYVRCVGITGSLYYDHAYATFRVHPLFKLHPSALVDVGCVDNAEDTSTDILQKLVGELGIPAVMEILTKVIAEQEE